MNSAPFQPDDIAQFITSMFSVPLQRRIEKKPVKNTDAFHAPFEKWYFITRRFMPNRHRPSTMESSVNFFPLDLLQ